MSQPTNPPPPIYTLDLSGVAWQLLWWLIARMGKDGVVRCKAERTGWRRLAASEMGRDRIHVQASVRRLVAAGLIECAPKERIVRVLVRNLVG